MTQKPLTPPPGLNITMPFRRGRRPDPCPCCLTPGGLCADHKARLAPIREELKREAKAKSAEGLRKRSPQIPTCSSIGCWNPRTPPLPVCSECAEDSE